MNLSLLPAATTSNESDSVSSSSSIAALFTDAGLPADFAELLGDQLTQLSKGLTAKDATTLKSSLAATTDITADTDGGKLTTGNSKLNQLLAALGDISAILPAGLTHAGQTGDAASVKKTTVHDGKALDKDTLDGHLLDNSGNKADLSALQTLLAMLPHQVANTLNTEKKISLTDSSGKNSSAKQDATTLIGMTLQDKGLAALIGSALNTVTGDKKPAGTELLSGTTNSKAKNTTLQDKLARLTVQDTESALSAKTTPLTAQTETSLPAASADKTLLSATLVTPSVSAVSSPVITTNSLISSPATGHLSPQLGSQEWQQSLGQQVVMFSRNGQQSAELRLHPQELGALQISLKIEDNQAQLHFASAHSQVRAALEAAMPSLRSALAESGIQLGQSSVGSEGQWQQAQQQSQQAFAPRNQPAYGETVATDPLIDTLLVTPTTLQALAIGKGGVDIFA